MARCRKGHGEYTGNECPICKRGKRHVNKDATDEQWIAKWRSFSINTKWCILYVKGFARYVKHFPEVKVISDTCNPLREGICVTDGLMLKLGDTEFFDTINHEKAYQEPINSVRHTVESSRVLGEE